MPPATVALLMCGTLLTNGDLHHEHQTEAQLVGLAKLPSSRLLADSSDYMLEFLVQLSALLVVHTPSLCLYCLSILLVDVMDRLWPSQALTLHSNFY